jgi:dienelactone hydrolase
MILFHINFTSFTYNFVEYHVIDTSRKEMYPHDAAHSYREFMMHVWIPVVYAQQCPLILFSHGLGDNFNGMTYTKLCEYCVSHGYVVASVSHTHGCKSIQFSDGRVAPYLFPASIHYQPNKHMFDIEADIWLEDMLCALNECVRQNISENSALYNAIDMSRIGVMGHSLGGSAAIALARQDDRISAVINLDGPLYGTDIMQPIHQPLMVIIGSSVEFGSAWFGRVTIPSHAAFFWRWCFNNAWLPQLNTFMSLLHTDVYTITIDGIVHDMFSDAALTPDPVIAQWLIDGAHAHTIIHSYIGAFFDCYLKYQYVPLIHELVSCWPNVTVEKSNVCQIFPSIF